MRRDKERVTIQVKENVQRAMKRGQTKRVLQVQDRRKRRGVMKKGREREREFNKSVNQK